MTYNLGNYVLLIAATNYKLKIRAAILDRTSHSVWDIDVPNNDERREFFKSAIGYDTINDDTILGTEQKSYMNTIIDDVITELPRATTFRRNLEFLYDGAREYYMMEHLVKDELLYTV